MSEKTAKILIGLIGVFCLLGFIGWLATEEEEVAGNCYLGREEAHDVLERGEKAVLEYLTKKDWTGLKILDSRILPPPEGERGILHGGAMVAGEKGKDMARFEVHYAVGPNCEVHGVTTVEKEPWQDW